jgi:CubicO group peptidase (beta-lactamase class C family)
MIARTCLILNIAVVSSAAVAHRSGAQVTADSGLSVRVDSIFGKWYGDHSPGCAVGVSRDGDILFTKGYGMANLENQVAIAPTTVFNVASVAKQFTALAIVLLAQQNELSLDDDVRKYIPEVPTSGTTITLRHLLHHTSGLRDVFELLYLAGWRDADLITRLDLLDIVSRQRGFDFVPGTSTLYTSTGYTLLAEVVRRVSGRTLREFAQESIFAPLGMTHTIFRDDHTTIVPNAAAAYMTRPGGGWSVSMPTFDHAGETNLYTTVEDLARWNRNFSTHEVGGDAGWAMMFERGVVASGDSSSYALGFGRGQYRGLSVLAHSGWHLGYRSSFVRYAESHLAVAVLCNTSSLETPSPPSPAMLGARVAELFLGDRMQALPQPVTARPAAAPAPPPAPATELRSLAGVYWSPSTDGVMRVEANGGKLIAFGIQRLELIPVEPGRYSVGTAMTFSFSGTGSGRRMVQRANNARDSVVWEGQTALAGPLTAAGLAALAGSYISEELAVTYTLVVRGDSLVLQRRKFSDVVLRPLFLDAFRMACPPGPCKVESKTMKFQRDSRRNVTGYLLGGGPGRGIVFTRQ